MIHSAMVSKHSTINHSLRSPISVLIITPELAPLNTMIMPLRESATIHHCSYQTLNFLINIIMASYKMTLEYLLNTNLLFNLVG